jgi:hypothetical protein
MSDTSPTEVYCDESMCKFNCSGECCAEELSISIDRECESYEPK